MLLAAAAGLLSLFTLLYFLHRPAPLAPPPGRDASRLVWGGVALLVGAVWCFTYQAPVILSNPLDARASDVIPILQNYVARFRSGEVVYRYITNLPTRCFPTTCPCSGCPTCCPTSSGSTTAGGGLGLLVLLGFGAWQVALARQPIAGLGFAA